MKGLVLVKQVPNTDSPFRLNAAATWVDEANLTFGLNDYDRYALEELLRLKDAGKVTEVVVLTVGPERAATALRTCLATGADRAIHVKDDALQGSDPLSLARVIHAAVKDEGFSLILAGLQADDDNHGQMGGLLARLMDRPCASAALSLALQEGGVIRVERELENNRLQVVDLTLPAVITVQTGINEPRYASLKGIMAAKKKEIRTVGLKDLGLDAGQVGGKAARLKTLRLAPPPKGKGAEMLQGPADKVAQEILRRIREKTGVV
ncbi:MAG TPA: electron transfer flavoprotein subunit beta/FixA family protein [Candidatus Polarisedimenticolia bacterium]|nr:electron transfer flavoprotein subunit beta/FixA family protein [Candidatus Polarisedimenticolia bacterium]